MIALWTHWASSWLWGSTSTSGHLFWRTEDKTLVHKKQRENGRPLQKSLEHVKKIFCNFRPVSKSSAPQILNARMLNRQLWKNKENNPARFGSSANVRAQKKVRCFFRRGCWPPLNTNKSFKLFKIRKEKRVTRGSGLGPNTSAHIPNV